MTEGGSTDQELEMMSRWYAEEEMEADMAEYRAKDAFAAALREKDPAIIPLGIVGFISQLTKTISREGNEQFHFFTVSPRVTAEGFVELSWKRRGKEDPSWTPTKVEITLFSVKP